jgi:hypothetical protein
MTSTATPDAVASTTITPATNTSGGRNNCFNKGLNAHIIKQVKFEGRSDAMKGHVYDCSDAKQSDQFTKTTKEVADYIVRTYKYGGICGKQFES